MRQPNFTKVKSAYIEINLTRRGKYVHISSFYLAKTTKRNKWENLAERLGVILRSTHLTNQWTRKTMPKINIFTGE